MEFWYTASKTFAMLCVVLGVMLAFLYALKRLTQKGGIEQCHIKLVSSFNIAPRKQVMVLDVMQERIVLGVTTDHISCISKYPISTVEEDKTPVRENKLSTSKMIEGGLEQNQLTGTDHRLSKSNNNPNNVSQVQSEL